MTRLPTIGVFDSGMGGLTVLAALRELLPGAAYRYAFDNAHFPYGTKTEAEVVEYTTACIARLVEGHGADVVVIACNTASVTALAAARARFAVPIVGTVPAIKPAAAQSITKTIALLATPGTVLRPYTDDLERQFAQGCLVLRRGSSKLVELAERKMHGEQIPLAEVAAELKPLFDASPQEASKRLDTIVLGCTHFPLLAAEIAAAAPWPVRLVDPGPAIAARARTVIAEAGFEVLAAARAPRTSPLALASAMDAGVEALRPALARLGFGDIRKL
jgi:glutamate racemase